MLQVVPFGRISAALRDAIRLEVESSDVVIIRGLIAPAALDITVVSASSLITNLFFRQLPLPVSLALVLPGRRARVAQVVLTVLGMPLRVGLVFGWCGRRCQKSRWLKVVIVP